MGCKNHCQHDLSLGDRYLQAVNSDLERLAQFFGVPITVFFPQAEPKSRTNALLTATADLDETDLEEVMLYAQFRKARHRAQEGARDPL